MLKNFTGVTEELLEVKLEWGQLDYRYMSMLIFQGRCLNFCYVEELFEEIHITILGNDRVSSKLLSFGLRKKSSLYCIFYSSVIL